MLALQGRLAAVTGGARGLGRAIAVVLAERGADVAVLARDPTSAGAVVAQIRALGRRAEAFHCDLRNERSVTEAARQTATVFGRVDILVCNSGIAGPTASLWETPPAEWRDTLWVNAVGTFLCCHAFLPGMIERGSGNIVLVGSMTGKRPLPGRSSYAASKLALVGLARTLAVEAGVHGVRVNVVSPGPVEGERIEQVLANQAALLGITTEEARERMLRDNSLGRFVSAGDVAAAVAFLASEAAASITGEDLNVSAGTVMY